MTEFKYDGVFQATDTQVSLISRRISRVPLNKYKGMVCFNTDHPPDDFRVSGNTAPERFKVKAYNPKRVLKAVWKNRDGTEEISVFWQSENMWQVRYRGPGTFDDFFFKVFIEALPFANPCAAVCLQLIKGAGENIAAPNAQSRVISAARTLVTTQSQNKALTLIPPLMAAKLAVLPKDVLETGIRILRRRLASQIAA